MEQFAKMLRDIYESIITALRSVLIFLLAVSVIVGYLLYRAASWLVENPAIMLLPPAALMMVWLLKRYVLGRNLAVGDATAVIIKRADGKMESLFRGWHKLRLGDKVCKRLSLRPQSVETNQEEVVTRDEESVRLSANYDLQIFNPLRYYQRGRKQQIDFAGLHQDSLFSTLSELSFDDLYNVPYEINAHIEQLLNDQLRSYGLQINHYSLAEIMFPRTNERWQRNKALRVGEYWSEVKNFRQRLG